MPEQESPVQPEQIQSEPIPAESKAAPLTAAEKMAARVAATKQGLEEKKAAEQLANEQTKENEEQKIKEQIISLEQELKKLEDQKKQLEEQVLQVRTQQHQSGKELNDSNEILFQNREIVLGQPPKKDTNKEEVDRWRKEYKEEKRKDPEYKEAFDQYIEARSSIKETQDQIEAIKSDIQQKEQLLNEAKSQTPEGIELGEKELLAELHSEIAKQYEVRITGRDFQDLNVKIKNETLSLYDKFGEKNVKKAVLDVFLANVSKSYDEHRKFLGIDEVQGELGVLLQIESNMRRTIERLNIAKQEEQRLFSDLQALSKDDPFYKQLNSLRRDNPNMSFTSNDLSVKISSYEGSKSFPLLKERGVEEELTNYASNLLENQTYSLEKVNQALDLQEKRFSQLRELMDGKSTDEQLQTLIQNEPVVIDDFTNKEVIFNSSYQGMKAFELLKKYKGNIGDAERGLASIQQPIDAEEQAAKQVIIDIVELGFYLAEQEQQGRSLDKLKQERSQYVKAKEKVATSSRFDLRKEYKLQDHSPVELRDGGLLIHLDQIAATNKGWEEHHQVVKDNRMKVIAEAKEKAEQEVAEIHKQASLFTKLFSRGSLDAREAKVWKEFKFIEQGNLADIKNSESTMNKAIGGDSINLLIILKNMINQMGDKTSRSWTEDQLVEHFQKENPDLLTSKKKLHIEDIEKALDGFKFIVFSDEFDPKKALVLETVENLKQKKQRDMLLLEEARTNKNK